MTVYYESTYTVFEAFGGPFHGRHRLESSSLLDCDVHCEGDDGFVHVYTPVGSSLFYTRSYKMVRPPRPASDEMSHLQKGKYGTSRWIFGAF